MKLKVYIAALFASIFIIACENAFESGQGEKQIRTTIRVDTVFIKDTLIVTEEKIIEIEIIEIDTVRDTIYDTVWIDKDYPKDLSLQNDYFLFEDISVQLLDSEQFLNVKYTEHPDKFLIQLENATLDEEQRFIDLNLSSILTLETENDSIPLRFGGLILNDVRLEVNADNVVPLKSQVGPEADIYYFSPFNLPGEIELNSSDLNIVVETLEEGQSYLITILGEVSYDSRNMVEIFPFEEFRNDWFIQFELN